MRKIIGKILLLFPIIRYKQFVYQILGVNKVGKSKYFIGNPKLIGDYSNLYMHDNSEIERNCFILAKDRIYSNESIGMSVKLNADGKTILFTFIS